MNRLTEFFPKASEHRDMQLLQARHGLPLLAGGYEFLQFEAPAEARECIGTAPSSLAPSPSSRVSGHGQRAM
jgi:hypothetical protein